jgi:peptidoglycan glycosyltransferase
MVAGAIANGGSIMKPHVVREVRDRDGEIVRRIEPEEWKRAVSPETALAVGRMMLDVVQAGTGSRAAVPGVKVAGKTGTAQAPCREAGPCPPHAWFVGYAPYDNPRFAIAVIVERGGDVGDEATGGRVAAPVAGEVLAKLLAIPPAPESAGDEPGAG